MTDKFPLNIVKYDYVDILIFTKYEIFIFFYTYKY